MADLAYRQQVLETLRTTRDALTQISLRLWGDPDPATREVARFVGEARDSVALGLTKANRVGWPNGSDLAYEDEYEDEQNEDEGEST